MITVKEFLVTLVLALGSYGLNAADETKTPSTEEIIAHAEHQAGNDWIRADVLLEKLITAPSSKGTEAVRRTTVCLHAEHLLDHVKAARERNKFLIRLLGEKKPNYDGEYLIDGFRDDFIMSLNFSDNFLSTILTGCRAKPELVFELVENSYVEPLKKMFRKWKHALVKAEIFRP